MAVEFWYDWPETEGGKFHLSLRIDEDASTVEEIEAEIEFWTNELFAYDPPDPHRTAIRKAIKWMSILMGTRE